MPCALEKDVYSAILGWNLLNISVKSIWSSVSFKVTVSFLIFYLDGLSIDTVRVSPQLLLYYYWVVTLYLLLTVLCICILTYLVHKYLQLLYLLVGLSLLFSCSVFLCLVIVFVLNSIYIVQCNYCCSDFLLTSVCVINVSLSPHFQATGL